MSGIFLFMKILLGCGYVGNRDVVHISTGLVDQREYESAFSFLRDSDY